MIIESKAPTRVDFAGSTLDIWPLYLFHPGSVTLNAAISRYASCVIHTHAPGMNASSSFRRDIKREESFASFATLLKTKRYRLPLLAEIVKFFQPARRIHADHGFRSSRRRGHRRIKRHGGGDLRRARPLHRGREEQGRLDSHQPRRRSHRDQRSHRHAGSLPAGVWRRGGHRVVPPGGERRVEMQRESRRTGTPHRGLLHRQAAAHGINNWEVFKAQIGGNRAVQNRLERISDVAQSMRIAMEKPDWHEAGRLMREEWSFRKRNLPTISTKTIDRVISGARRKGALAGKVCGAGGGGCVVLLIEPDARTAWKPPSLRPAAKFSR